MSGSAKQSTGWLIGRSLGTVKRTKRSLFYGSYSNRRHSNRASPPACRTARSSRPPRNGRRYYSEAVSLLEHHVPDLLATNVVLTYGSATSLAEQAVAAGAKILMITGSPDRIIEFDGSGQRYLSKPFPPEAFLRQVQEILRRAESTICSSAPPRGPPPHSAPDRGRATLRGNVHFSEAIPGPGARGADRPGRIRRRAPRRENTRKEKAAARVAGS